MVPTRFGPTLLAVLAVLAFLLLAAGVRADTILFKNGRSIEGEVLHEGSKWIEVKTRYGTQKIDRATVKEIRRGLTPEQQLAKERDEVEPDDLDGLVRLARFAGENRLRADARELWESVLGLDPDHEEANLALGRVRYQGEWYTRTELERKQEEEWRARGYVRYDDEWIPVEEAERRRAQEGAEAVVTDEAEPSRIEDAIEPEVNARVEDALAAQAEIHDAVGATPLTVTTEHFLIVSFLDREQSIELGRKAEETVRWVFELLEGDPLVRPWPGQARYYAFDGRTRYADFLTRVIPHYIEDPRFRDYLARAAAEGRLSGMSSRTNGIPFFADFQVRDTRWNNLIHAKVSIYCLENYCGRIPPWLRSGFAAFAEIELTGESHVRSFTNPRYGGRADLADKATDSTKWPELLRYTVRSQDDPALGELAHRALNAMDFLDLSKAWSVVDFLIETRHDAFVEYCRLLRRGSPHEAFERAMGAPYEAIDTEWRGWLTKKR